MTWLQSIHMGRAALGQGRGEEEWKPLLSHSSSSICPCPVSGAAWPGTCCMNGLLTEAGVKCVTWYWAVQTARTSVVWHGCSLQCTVWHPGGEWCLASLHLIMCRLHRWICLSNVYMEHRDLDLLQSSYTHAHIGGIGASISHTNTSSIGQYQYRILVSVSAQQKVPRKSKRFYTNGIIGLNT